ISRFAASLRKEWRAPLHNACPMLISFWQRQRHWQRRVIQSCWAKSPSRGGQSVTSRVTCGRLEPTIRWHFSSRERKIHFWKPPPLKVSVRQPRRMSVMTKPSIGTAKPCSWLAPLAHNIPWRKPSETWPGVTESWVTTKIPCHFTNRRKRRLHGMVHWETKSTG